jgi:hypothetical protein
LINHHAIRWATGTPILSTRCGILAPEAMWAWNCISLLEATMKIN